MKKALNLLASAIVLVIVISLCSCNKLDVPKGTPKAIKKKIRETEGDCLVKVYEYEYKGEVIYYFLDCKDSEKSGFFVNSEGESVCDTSPPLIPDGTPSCIEYYEGGTKIDLIWEK